MSKFSGKCLCGAISYEITGALGSIQSLRRYHADLIQSLLLFKNLSGTLNVKP